MTNRGSEIPDRAAGVMETGLPKVYTKAPSLKVSLSTPALPVPTVLQLGSQHLY